MGGDAGDLEQCAHCESRLPMEKWCPVVTTTDEDGSTRLLSFCDEMCKDAWAGEEGDATFEGR